MNLTYTNIVLKVGGQILLLLIGIMIITFGVESPWPTSNVKRMVNGLQSALSVDSLTDNAIKKTAVAVVAASAATSATTSATTAATTAIIAKPSAATATAVTKKAALKKSISMPLVAIKKPKIVGPAIIKK